MLKLHLGCFHKKIYGYTNVDIREDVHPDVVDDCFKLTKFNNDSVDVIYTSHMLEHCLRSEYKKVLKRWHEVLNKGGILRIAVPDFEALCKYYLETKDAKAVENCMFGSQKHPYDFHYIGLDEATLKKDLEDIGFTNVHRYDWRLTEHFYIDDYSQCYLPHMTYSTRRPEGKIGGTLVSLNMEATK